MSNKEQSPNQNPDGNFSRVDFGSFLSNGFHVGTQAQNKAGGTSNRTQSGPSAANKGSTVHQSLPDVELPGRNNLISSFARELGAILASHDFYWRMDKCMVPKTNEMGRDSLVAVSPHEFRTHVENFCTLYKVSGSRQVACSMTQEDASTVLVSRVYLTQLRPVTVFNLIQLPAYYPGNEIKLLPLGYDTHHKALTSQKALQYPLNIPLDNAKFFLNSLLEEFPFVAQDKLLAYSAVLAACLTPFCIHLLPAQSLRPAFLVSSNSEGSGKTLLWKIVVIALLGYAPIETMPETEEEMRKTIASTVLKGSPVFFLDNIKGKVASPSLESMITSNHIKFRLLGRNDIQENEHKTVVFLTANDARISPDMRRRLISLELFLEDAVPESRQIVHPMGDGELVKRRPQILGSLWSLVQNWQSLGRPMGSVINQTFLEWSEVIGGILEAAGYPSPCKIESGVNVFGDIELNQMQQLVAELKCGAVYDVKTLVAIARNHHLFESIVGTIDDPEQLDPSNRSRFGLLLKRFNGRILPIKIWVNGNLVPAKVRFQLVSKTVRKMYGIATVF